MFATVQDIEDLKRPLTNDEKTRTAKLINIVEAELIVKAKSCGKDLEQMTREQSELASIVKSVVVDVVMRELVTTIDQEPMTQMSQAALGYSISGTFLNGGGGIFIKRSELKRIGITRQRIGAVKLWG